MMMMTVMITAGPDTVMSKRRGVFRGKLTILAACMYMWLDMPLSMSHKPPQSPAHFFIFIVGLFLQNPFSYMPYSFLKMKKIFLPMFIFLLNFCKCFPLGPEYLFFSWKVNSYLSFDVSFKLPLVGEAWVPVTPKTRWGHLLPWRLPLPWGQGMCLNHLYTQSGTEHVWVE